MRKISAIISISSFSSQLYYIGYQKNAKEQPLQKNIPFQLDHLVGHNEALFRRAELKALVSIHGQEV